MLKKIFEYFYEKKIIYEFNLLTSQIINHLVLICNVNEPLNLKIGLNRYFWSNNIGDFEITYNNLISKLERGKFNGEFSEIIKSKATDLYNVGELLLSVHQKILANNFQIQNEFIEYFRLLIDVLWIFNAETTRKFSKNLLLLSNGKLKQNLTVMSEIKKNIKSSANNQSGNYSALISSIFDYTQKIINLVTK